MTMTLDKRIYEDRRIIFTCFTAEAAKKYLGQQGFFADEMYAYHDLDHVDFRTLTEVGDDETPFSTGQLCYQFFLPAEFVRPVEEKKEWRPFTLDEFLAKFPLLSPVTYRWKKGDRSFTMCVTGYEVSDGREYVILGGRYYGFCELVCENELQDKDGNWTPFGVEE